MGTHRNQYIYRRKGEDGPAAGPAGRVWMREHCADRCLSPDYSWKGTEEPQVVTGVTVALSSPWQGIAMYSRFAL